MSSLDKFSIWNLAFEYGKLEIKLDKENGYSEKKIIKLKKRWCRNHICFFLS